MDFGHFQPPIWRTIDYETTQNWRLTNSEYKTFEVVVVVLMLLFGIFDPHKCTSLIIFEQVVCTNILRCQLFESHEGVCRKLCEINMGLIHEG